MLKSNIKKNNKAKLKCYFWKYNHLPTAMLKIMNQQKKTFSDVIGKSAKSIFSLFLFLLLFVNGKSQENLPYIDISKILFSDSLSNKISVSFSEKDVLIIDQFKSLNFIQGSSFKKQISPENVAKNIVIKYNVYNSDDTTHGVFLYPGNYVEKIKLYSLKHAELTALPKILANISDSIGYHYLSLNAGDTATIVAEISFLKTYTNSLNPKLVNENYIRPFVQSVREKYESLNIFTYIMCGLMLMMFLYSLASFIQGSDHDFLLYAGYVIFSGALLFSKSFFGMQSSSVNYFLESYLDLILQGLGFIFYMLFMIRFLSTSKKYPFINKLYTYSTILVVLLMILFSAFHFLSGNYLFEYYIENFIKIYLLAINLTFLIYSINKLNDHLLRFIFWGNFWLFVFSILSFILILTNIKFSTVYILLNNSLLYYEVGLFFELSFFLQGLIYKNRTKIIKQTREKELLKIENHRIEFEKELAVYKAQQSERHRIATDMHDELGSGMTAIRLYSEIAKNRLKENTPAEIIKISNSANNLLSNLNAIIWSMNSSNDTIDNFISYIRTYSIDYFDGTAINCKFDIPASIPDIEITGAKRRNLFMCIKETLNNSLKYSEADELRMEFTINHHLKISISDNGKGIDLENLRTFGNGLKNIKHRMEHIEGSFEINNLNGTVTILELPLY